MKAARNWIDVRIADRIHIMFRYIFPVIRDFEGDGCYIIITSWICVAFCSVGVTYFLLLGIRKLNEIKFQRHVRRSTSTPRVADFDLVAPARCTRNWSSPDFTAAYPTSLSPTPYRLLHPLPTNFPHPLFLFPYILILSRLLLLPCYHLIYHFASPCIFCLCG